MKHFDANFSASLKGAIQTIESRSGAEIVVAVSPGSDSYHTVSLLGGILFSFLSLFVTLFIPVEYHVWEIFSFSIYGLLLGFSLLHFITPLKRALIPERVLRTNVELHARSYFQKAGICGTSERTGLLIYFSFFEKIAYLLPDTGLRRMIPAGEWDSMEQALTKVYSSSRPAGAILEALESLAPTFARHVPRSEYDKNELSDDLGVDE